MQGRDLSADLFGPAPSAAPVGRDLSADLFGAPSATPAASVGRDLSADLFGAKAPAKKEERPEDQSFLRQVADVPLKVAGGAAMGVRMIADAFGADSSVSKNMRGVEDWIGELYSAQSKQDSKRMAQIMKEAEDKGVKDQIVAAVQAFKQAPVDLTVSALGTAAPAILAGISTFLLGAPAAVTTAAGLGVGALMGSGTVKSSIYDATKQTLTEQKDLKLTPEQIEKIAVEAQSYGGKNTDMILAGTILGAIGARTGAEPVIARGLAQQIIGKAVEKEAQQAVIKEGARKATEAAAKRGIVKQGLRTGATEFGTEFTQAGQEQLAQNIALQREGFDVPTMRGVVGQGTLEGLAGLGMGAVTGGRQAYTAKRELAAEQQPITPAEESQFTTERETVKRRLAAAPTAEDIDALTPITDRAGKPLVGAAPETLTAKEKADADAAAAAEAAKLSLDEATTKANELLAKVDAGGAVKQTEFRPVAKALGVKIPFGTKNADAVELIRAHLAQQGAPSAATTGTDESAAGAGAGVAGQSGAVAPAAGPDTSGVVPPAPTAGPATAGAGAQPDAVTPAAPAPAPAAPAAAKKSAVQADRDELDSLFDDDKSSLSARRTDAEITRDQKMDQIGRRFGLSRSADETAQQFRARIKEAMDFEEMREDKPLSELSGKEVAGQTLREDSAYVPPDLQIEAYEEARKIHNDQLSGDEQDQRLPAYKELSADDRRVYFQEGLPRPGAGTAAQHAAAAKKLAEYRSIAKEEAEPYQLRDKQTGELLFNEDGTPMMATTTLPGESQARESYNRERGEFGRKSGLSYSFPIWNLLSDASKQAYININKTDTVLEQDMAFRAIKAQIQKEKTEAARTAALTQAETDATREMLAAAARARKSQPAGKGDILPDNILEKLLAGDTAAVLEYIKERGNGLRLKKGYDLVRIVTKTGQVATRRGVVKVRDSVAMGVFRNLAARLLDVEGLKVNVVYDENMVYDQIARYDAKTNTMYVGPNGLDEATVLHELLHAATVKIIHQFYTDASKLSAHARKAVEHLIQIAAMAKARLGSNPQYAGAFENLYEFVAYSQTDLDFQHALAQEQIGSLATVTAKTTETFSPIQTELEAQRESKEGAKMYDAFMDNLWNAYTGTLAYLYSLFRPGQTTTKIYGPTETSRLTTNQAAPTKEELALRDIKQKKLTPKGDESAEEFNQRINERVVELKTKLRELKESDAERIEGAVRRLEKEIQALEDSKIKTAAKESQEALESLFDNPEEEMQEASIPDQPSDLVNYRGISNLKQGILRAAGYKGNLLLEASEMVSLILEAPEGNIERLAGKEGLGAELYARTPRKKKGAPAATTDVEEGTTPPERTGGINDPKNREFYELKGKEKIVSRTGQAWRAIRTAAGWRDIVRRFQDKSVESRSLHKKLDMAGLIKRGMDEAFNNFDELRDLATGVARNYLNTYLRAPMDNIKQLIGDYAKLTKKPLDGKDGVLVDLHMFSEMFHEPERRHFKWLRSVPLSTTKNLTHNGKRISAADRRIDILGDPRVGKPGLVDRVELTQAQLQQLRAELEYLAKNYADPLGDSPRIKSEQMRERVIQARKKKNLLGVMNIEEDNSTYNVLGINKAEVDLRRQQYDALDPKQRELLDKIFAEAKVITDRSAELDKIGNYWSYPVSNLVGLYDYQHYMPFKGVSKHSVVDQYLSFDSEATGKDMQDVAHSADGRFSVSDNPFLQMMSDAFRSAGRAGRRDYMQSIKNAVKPNKLNPTGTGVIEGEVVKHIEFAERNIVDLSEFKGGSNIFVYNSDGSIDIVRINEPKILNALRYSFRDASPMLDMANAVTGFFGAMHTRYNYNFAPLNFVRDALTNAWNIGASKLGPLKSAKYIQMMSAAIVKNGLGKAMEVAYLHEKGDPVSKRILLNAAKNDPFVRDMLEYLQFGGKTTYMESFSLKSSLQDLSTKLGKRRIMDNVDSFNQFIDVWNNMFEFTSRTAAFTLYKKEALKRNIEKGMSNVKDEETGMSPAEVAAGTEAAAWTKNLANFEKAGEYAREMGAFYMFIRPSATGAVRAAEAALPAFRSMESALNDLPAEVRNDPAALEKFKKEYALERRNARIMITTLFGMGFLAYWMSSLMAPDDEWKRNNVKTDNMQQWTRFARFHIPNEVSQRLGLGRDVVFQLPWGFGLGAFAAIGAQFAGMTVGNSSFKDFFANSVVSMTDSFLPIPVSRMSPIESPESSLKWIIDSVAPTVVRPGVEFIMNTNGIGQAINSASSRRMGDAFTGGDRIPQIYKDAAEGLFLKTDGYLDWSPNTLYFFSNSYLDGLAKVGELGYSWSNLEKDKKEFNVKTDAALFGSFFGAKTNVDSREYGDIEKRIKELDKRLTTLDELAPARAARFDAENPLARGLVDAYKTRQGELNKLRAEANEIRRDPYLSPKDKQAMLRIATMQQNILKHEMVLDFKAYGEKP